MQDHNTNFLGCKSSPLGEVRVKEEIHPSTTVGTKREVSGRQRAAEYKHSHRIDFNVQPNREGSGGLLANREGKLRGSILAKFIWHPRVSFCRQRASKHVRVENPQPAAHGMHSSNFQICSHGPWSLC